MGESEYLLTNARQETVARFDALEETFDGLTTGHLGRIGVAPGWRCLELGAGSGSIAAWLATQVGSSGRVVATDLDVSRFRMQSLDQLEVRRDDLVTDALPVGPWDLIHERLVLQHVPARLQVLDRMVAALAPGGWIVLEDFDTAEVRTTDRDGPDHELIARVAVAFNGLLAAQGGVSSFAANARRLLMNRGLVDIGSSGHVSIASGGTGFARAIAANTRQVRDKLEASGFTSVELDHFLDMLDDPETLVGSPVLISTWGRRPIADRPDPSNGKRSDLWTADLRARLDELLDEYRASLHDALDGLTEEEARLRLVPSKTTLLGLVKHVTYVEGVWFDQAISGRSYAEIGIPTTPAQSFTVTKDDTIASVQAAHRQRCELSRRTMSALNLDAVVEGRGRRPVWGLQLQVLRELAQHAGHADILREQILDRRAD